MILVIDNYDSFVYNLVQYVGRDNPDVRVLRNDRVTTSDLDSLRPSGIIISPGPGRPERAGVSLEAVQWADNHDVPLLGVCLGLQAIAVAFGATVLRAAKIMHGKTSLVRHDGSSPFEGIPEELRVMRYHSLVVDRSTITDRLRVSASTLDDDEIMGLTVADSKITGVQFHPESIATEHGERMVANFLARTR